MNEIENKHRRTVLLMGIALILCILASFTLGRYPVSPAELLGVLGYKLGLPIKPFWTSSVEAAVWNIRLPRVILSVLVGGCLASAGGAYQGVFQNPMASPDILGASAGAGFGAALAIMTFNTDVSISELFSHIYEDITGVKNNGFTILEISYSIGIGLGIIIFYNHFSKKRLSNDPTPVELEMRKYQTEIETSLVEGVHNKEAHIDVD